MVTMASPMLSKNSRIARRRASGSRVTANPKKLANTTSGRMASSEAALMAFCGARPFTKSIRLGACLTRSGAATAPALSAAPPTLPTGHKA
jgi:hypothetical protein